MGKFKRSMAMAATFLMAATLLAGCGGGDKPAETKPDAAGGGETSQPEGGDQTSSGGDSAETPVTIKFANVTSESAKLAGDRFKEVAERESNGSLTIELYPDNMLGDDRVAIETTVMGDIDIGVSSTSPIATMYSDFYIFDAPYLFLNTEDAYAKIDGPTGQAILDGMESIGLKGICLWENGFRNFTNNKVEVKRPEDVKGMKVRTMENEVHLAAWKAFGANPTPMAFTELFTALQQGTVDAQENPLGIIDANKFAEVQKYVSLTQHVYTPYIVCMNLDKYNSLSDNQKAAIEKAAAESLNYQREQSQAIEQKILEGFEAQGVTVVELSDEDKAAWQQVVNDAKVFDLVKEKMDHPEYVDQMLAE